ncbi:MAG: LacI family transcriptional regulator [Herpetosiphonaceae bacterium]|nr:MAG: LacI family transcriptional regulator [Herpetosiphonaceae bacterium]
MTRNKPTIFDVARKAGVGIGTVSRVLNGAPNVKQATRERVLQVIEELGYRPSHAARQLATSRTFTIGVIVPFITRAFFVEVLRGVEQVIAGTAYNLVIYNVETPRQRAYYLEQLPFLGRIDGLLIISLPLRQRDVEQLLRNGPPTVLIDEYHPALTSVQSDNTAGARMAIEHLLRLGHERIAVIGDTLNHPLGFRINRERLGSYRRTLELHHIAVRDEYQRWSEEYGREGGKLLANELLSLTERPTAIFALNDMMALGVLEAARDAAIQVPQDLAVIGYDDIELASYLNLTTVRQPMSEMGRRGATLLLNILADGSEQVIHQRLPVELVIRGTTAPSSKQQAHSSAQE